MDVSELLGDYLNADTAKEGDIVEILDEGTKAKIGEKEVLNIKCALNGKGTTYTPNRKSIKILRTAWGAETKDWIGRKFQVKFVFMEVQGKELQIIRPVPLQ